MLRRCRVPTSLVLLALGISCVRVTRTAPATASSAFASGNVAVHPMSVAPLVGDLADEQPSIAAVDLEGSASNKSTRPSVTRNGGTVQANNGSGGFVAYRVVGTTPGGLYVLVVMVNGGGSGVFEDVLWVKLVREQVREDGKRRERTSLVKVGQMTLGNRDDGTVRLDGARLSISKSRYRDHDMVIDLD